MTAIAISREGGGDIYLFKTRTDAYLCPIINLYLDPIFERAEDLFWYTRLEWRSLSILAGVRPSIDWYELENGPQNLANETRLRTCREIWRGLLEKAVAAPADPKTICDIIVTNRRKGPVIMAKKETIAKSVDPADATTTAAASTEPKAPKGPKGIPSDGVIQFLKDKNDKFYGPDNNPKRAGSKGHERFALYEAGKTVADTIASGVWPADIKWDLEKSFIEIVGGTVAPAADPAVAEASTEEVDAEDDESDNEGDE